MNKSVLNAFKWSVAAEWASKAIQPLVFVILSKILNPIDYGVVAAALMVISFAQIFWESGINKAIIQSQDGVEKIASIAFWLNLFLAILVTILLFVFSDLIASKLFHDIRVSVVLRVMTIQIILGAIASVHTALLQKKMEFNRLFWVKITTVALPAFFSIPLAYNGMSYWALVIGVIVGQVAQVFILWRIEKWKPEFSFDFHLAKKLAKFSVWVCLYGVLAWFYIWIDSLFVGSYLGTYHLGLYRTGNQFVSMIYGFLFAPLLPVLYSHFSTIQEHSVRLKNLMLKIIQVLALISIPLGFFLFSLNEPIEYLVFGEKWKGIGFVIGVMALSQGYAWVIGANGELYRAIGKPAYETIIPLATLVLYIGGYFFSIQKGFETFVWTRFYLAIIGTFLHVLLGWKVAQLSIWKVLRMMFFASIIGFSFFIFKSVLKMHVANPYYQIGLISLFSMALLGSLIFLLKKEDPIKDFMWIIKTKAFQAKR